jgi:succinate-semialdehyde dehydrogenase/glutarate-semialdehyde dehydrogenase
MKTLIRSVNPATEEIIAEYPVAGSRQVERALQLGATVFRTWRTTPLEERALLLGRLAAWLREHRTESATIITSEMGKPIVEAEAEVEKCAWCCQFYAENGAAMLAPQKVSSTAAESYIEFPPLGMILAVMPWNFPFWQVFRFAAPALTAGNTAILKHASCVPQCALTIERAFREVGFPDGSFQTLILPSASVSAVVEDPRIAAVTLTGSDPAGREVAAAAGRSIKKSVLELGGSDPFVVLADADLEAAISTGVRARFQNAGQSCIAAKRFIIVREVFEAFRDGFATAVRNLRVGDPMDRSTQVGPLARPDLREALERQVRQTLREGASLLVGGERCSGRGFFFQPTVLSHVTVDMTACREELFGPVAPVLSVEDAEQAIQAANQTPFGLGASLWTHDPDQARRLAPQIEAGQVFINGMVMSDPRLPFGGVKLSGYGRELSDFGIREFVNIQTVWIGPPR